MTKTKKVPVLKGFLLVIIFIIFSTTAVWAAATSRTGVATGHYRNPQTNIIEDSGGEENEALGQSMVDNVVGSAALLEQADGQYYMTVRFNLASNLSRIDISTQEAGESEWTAVETTEKGTGEDSVDLCFPVKSADTIIRAECFVDAMGRAVVFFITVSDYTDGNTSGYSDLDLTKVSSGSNSSGSGSDLLDGVQGLTTGDSSAGKTTAETGTDSGKETDSQDGSTVSSATLVLGAGVWVRIFLIAFCGCLLAGLVIELLKILLQKLTSKKEKKQELNLDDEEDENENDDIMEGDWDEND